MWFSRFCGSWQGSIAAFAENCYGDLFIATLIKLDQASADGRIADRPDGGLAHGGVWLHEMRELGAGYFKFELC